MNLLNFQFLASISGIASGIPDNSALACPLSGNFNVLLSSSETEGSGTFGDQAFAYQNRVLPAGVGEEINLIDGSLANLLNQVIVDEEAFSFVRYYAVVHADASEASRILVGGEVTAGAFGGLLTDNTGSRTMRPGEGFVEFSRRADAMEVVGEGGTEPARSSILVMNPDGANDATYSIWIFGQKKGS